MVPRRSLVLRTPTRLLRPTASSTRARPFHSSRPQRNVLVDLSHQVFQNVHTASGLSWAVSIPLTACLFRLGFVPIQYWGLSLSKTKQSIQPLNVAHQSILVKHGAALYERRVFQYRSEYADWWKKESDRRTSRMRENYKFKSSNLPLVLGLGFLPIWAINFGVMQAMAGVGSRGALSYIFDPATLPQPEPGFETDGFLWIATLSEPDPTFFVLPGVFGLLTYISASRTVSATAARRSLANARMMYGRTSLQAIRATAYVMFVELIAFSPFIMFFMMTQASAALQLLLCGSAATQTFLSPVLRRLVGSNVRGVTKMTPQIPKLKHRYRDMHSMDEFRPPSGKDSQSPVSLGPQATLQDSKPNQPGRSVAQVPGSPASGPSFHQRR